MIPLVGFLPADDPRVVGTVDDRARAPATASSSGIAPTTGTSRSTGLPPGEGVFLPCSFWPLRRAGPAGQAWTRRSSSTSGSSRCGTTWACSRRSTTLSGSACWATSRRRSPTSHSSRPHSRLPGPHAALGGERGGADVTGEEGTGDRRSRDAGLGHEGRAPAPERLPPSHGVAVARIPHVRRSDRVTPRAREVRRGALGRSVRWLFERRPWSQPARDRASRSRPRRRARRRRHRYALEGRRTPARRAGWAGRARSTRSVDAVGRTAHDRGARY